jgi:hypothetical protein
VKKFKQARVNGGSNYDSLGDLTHHRANRVPCASLLVYQLGPARATRELVTGFPLGSPAKAVWVKGRGLATLPPHLLLAASSLYSASDEKHAPAPLGIQQGALLAP